MRSLRSTRRIRWTRRLRSFLQRSGQPHPCVQGATVLAYVERKDGPAPMLVDLSRVPELNRLAYDERSGLLIGAALPLAESLSASVVGDAYPILMDGLRALALKLPTIA